MMRDLDNNSKQMGMNHTKTMQDLQEELLASIKSLGTNTQLVDTTFQKLVQSIESLKPADEAAMEDFSQRLTRLSAQIANFTKHSRIIASEQAILKSLRFKAMHVRHGNIVNAHPETFDWVFDNAHSRENSTIKFQDWLECQSGLYWIVGKAGSGKSTLMKFLYQDRRTRSLLQKWAAERKLVMAKFFFWNAGTVMQKSQEGLLQSLLYEVLRQCPEFLSKVCSSRWLDYEYSDDEPQLWTRVDLLEVFNQLLQQEEFPVNFCFFIDGLDEYDGDHIELIKTLHQWPVSRFFKLCVSSRPWFMFKDAFGQSANRHLRVEDYTRQDIQKYIRATFNEHKRFEKLNAMDPRYNDLIKDIEEKAKGVFLWVFLVVRELSRGFTNADTMSILQRRLKALPSKLEDYFRHMFNQIEEIYRKETARFFQMALEAQEPLPLMVYAYLYEEHDQVSHDAQLKRLSNHDFEFREEEMQRRLDGCCKGLLEAHEQAEFNIRPKYVVEFLHRSTRDFLLTKDMQLIISSYVGQNFNPRIWLCNAFLYHLRKAPKNLYGAFRVVKKLICYCKAAEVHDHILQVDLLYQAEKIFVSYAGTASRIARTLFTNLVVERGLLLYTAHILKKSPDMIHAGDGFLDHALLWIHEINPDMVQLLLEHGASPNQKRGDTTVWGHHIFILYKSFCGHEENKISSRYLETLDLLLRHGADITQRILLAKEYVTPQDNRRAADLHKRIQTIKNYKEAREILREALDEQDAEWLLSRARSTRVQSS